MWTARYAVQCVHACAWVCVRSGPGPHEFSLWWEWMAEPSPNICLWEWRGPTPSSQPGNALGGEAAFCPHNKPDCYTSLRMKVHLCTLLQLSQWIDIFYYRLHFSVTPQIDEPITMETINLIQSVWCIEYCEPSSGPWTLAGLLAGHQDIHHWYIQRNSRALTCIDFAIVLCHVFCVSATEFTDISYEMRYDTTISIDSVTRVGCRMIFIATAENRLKLNQHAPNFCTWHHIFRVTLYWLTERAWRRPCNCCKRGNNRLQWLLCKIKG